MRLPLELGLILFLNIYSWTFYNARLVCSNPRPNRVNRELTVVLFFSPGELPACQFDEPLEDLPARGLDGLIASEDGPGIVIQVVAHG